MCNLRKRWLQSHVPPRHTGRRRAGFTLIELLVVIAIVAVLMALLVPAMSSLKGAGDFTKAVYDIQGTLDQARAYAMANNTYVYVGWQEVDADISANSATQNPGIGRVVMAVVASKEGTRVFKAGTTTLDPTKVVAISKLRQFDNLHLGQPIKTGNMERPPVAASNQVAESAAFDFAAPCFSWPLEGSAKYQFVKVIEIDPQGIPRPPGAVNDAIVDRLELGLIQSRGNVVIDTGTNNGQQAAIQLDGITSATRLFRP
jgi:prepilin-type N-terminal cleavage/methylation domain-containing protein